MLINKKCCWKKINIISLTQFIVCICHLFDQNNSYDKFVSGKIAGLNFSKNIHYLLQEFTTSFFLILSTSCITKLGSYVSFLIYNLVYIYVMPNNIYYLQNEVRFNSLPYFFVTVPKEHNSTFSFFIYRK